MKPNEFGAFAGNFTLPSDAPVGDYSMAIEHRLEGQEHGMHIAGDSYLVAEFRKPEFAVEVAAGKPAYINGESIDVSTAATFYFGGGLVWRGPELVGHGHPLQAGGRRLRAILLQRL